MFMIEFGVILILCDEAAFLPQPIYCSHFPIEMVLVGYRKQPNSDRNPRSEAFVARGATSLCRISWKRSIGWYT